MFFGNCEGGIFEPYPMALGTFLLSYDTVYSCCVEWKDLGRNLLSER